MPADAGGTDFHPGGLALVGEEGAEFVHLPRGSKVFSHQRSVGMARSSAAAENRDTPLVVIQP